MAISDHTRKRLWTHADNRCAFPGCEQELLTPTHNGAEETVVGIECHIVAQKDSPRIARSVSSLSAEEKDRWKLLIDQRDSYANLVVMCAVHSAVIDDPAQRFTVADIVDMKANHEAAVKQQRLDQIAARHAIVPQAATADQLGETSLKFGFRAVESAPVWSQKTLRELAQAHPDDLAWLLGEVGEPAAPEAGVALIRRWPYQLDDGSKELVNAVIRLAESGGLWDPASQGWERYADRFEGADRADILVRAAIDAGVGGDPNRRLTLLERARAADADSPRLRLEELDDYAPVAERLALLDELHTDDPQLGALIEAHKAIALMQAPDLDAAAEHLVRARELAPESMPVRAIDINLRIHRARVALSDDKPYSLTEAEQARDDALALRDELVAMGRWDESSRMLMLAADVSAVQREPDAARQILELARPEEAATPDGAEVLAEAALRAAAPELALRFVGAGEDDAARRLRATATLDIPGTDHASALAELEEIALSGGREADMSAFARLVACLPPVGASWNEDVAAVLTAERHQRFVSSLRVMAMAGSGDVIKAQELAADLPAEAWAAETRLRVAQRRGKLSDIRATAQEFMSHAPDAAGRVMAARGFLRAGDTERGEDILTVVAYDPNSPPRDRVMAFHHLLRSLADRDQWDNVDRHWKAWRDAFTTLRRADPLLSSWQVRVLHHGGGR